MSYFLRFRSRTSLAVKADDADPYEHLPEADIVRIEALRRTHAENASWRAAGSRPMSPEEFNARAEDYAAHVRRERAALAAARERTRRDPVLTSQPPPARLRSDGAAQPRSVKATEPKRRDPVIDAQPPPSSLRDDGQGVAKADSPEPPRRNVVIPRNQRIRKQAIDTRDLDLSRPADVAAAVRAAALRNRNPRS